MFLQRIPRKKGGEVYDYWALTKTVRTANGPRHQIMSYLGKLDAGDVQRGEHRVPRRAGKTHGAYILRTNTDCEDPAELWRWHIQLTEAESAFRDLKGDLALRPIYHHLQRRVEAHILVCFLSLCLWRTLEHWMGVSGLGDEARQFLAELRQVHSMDIHMPTRQGPTIRLRVVSKPEKELAVLLSRMKLRLPNVPLKLKM